MVEMGMYECLSPTSGRPLKQSPTWPTFWIRAKQLRGPRATISPLALSKKQEVRGEQGEEKAQEQKSTQHA